MTEGIPCEVPEAHSSLYSHQVDNVSSDIVLQTVGLRSKLLGRCPTVSITINGVRTKCLLDTGAETSLISEEFYSDHMARLRNDLMPVGKLIKLMGANGLEIPVHGYIEAFLELLGQKFKASFLVSKRIEQSRDNRNDNCPVILGCNILRKLESLIPDSMKLEPDWDLALTWVRSSSHVPTDIDSDLSRELPVLTLFSCEREVIPPRIVSRIRCKVDEDVKFDDMEFLVQPTPLCLTNDGGLREVRPCCVSDPSVLCQVLEGIHQFKGASVDIFVANASAEPVVIPPFTKVASAVQVVSGERIFVEPIGEGFSVSMHRVVSDGTDVLEDINSDDSSGEGFDAFVRSGGSEILSDRERFVFPDGSDFLLPPGVSLNHLRSEDALRAAELVRKHVGAFSCDPFDLGRCDLIPHQIKLDDAKPVNLPHRRIVPGLVGEVKQLLQDLLDRKIIRRSTSPYASPIVLVRKKNGQLRLCVDYRLLNAKTVKDAFPLPRIDETLESLAGAKLFSSLDMAHGYFQVAMHEDSIGKTAFRVPWGLYEFLRLPQGLSNAPGTFQRIVELIFGDLNLSELVMYLDDLLVFSSTFDEHLVRLAKVFERLENHGLKLNGKKCQLFQSSVRHLGHIVSREGVSVDPDKTVRIREWPIPTSVQQLRSFLGLASYYRRFVSGFSKVAEPLHALTRKEEEKAGNRRQAFCWSDEADKAFVSLKEALCSAPVLGYPDFSRDFVVEVDASLAGLGACLSQSDELGKLHPVAFASRGLRGAEKGYSDLSSFKLEFLALKWAVSEKFRDYLLGRHTVVFTDNNPLAHLRTAKLGAVEQRWAAQLAPFDLEIRFRSGKSNKCADALSRYPGHQSETVTLNRQFVCPALCDDDISVLHAVRAIEASSSDVVGPVNNSGSTPSVLPSFSLAELANLQREDEDLKLLWKRWRMRWEPGQDPPVGESLTPVARSLIKEWPRLREKNNILYRCVNDAGLGEVFQFLVPGRLRKLILEACHDQWGHQGVARTLLFIKRRCFWPGLSTHVQNHIKDCFQCRVAKAPIPTIRAPMSHLLAFQPLERLAIDFVKLDRGLGNIEDVLVLTDSFTKFSIAVPCRDQTAPTVARALRDHWFVHYGVPLKIHSDQGRNFESSLVRELCHLYGIKKTRTTPYHPQGNGQTERFNRTLCGLIKSLDGTSRHRWPELLPHLTYIYNCTPHSVTGFAPYTLMFGRQPVVPVDQLISNTRSEWSEDSIRKQAEIIRRTSLVVKGRLTKSAEANKRRYDRKATTVRLVVGARVLLKQMAHSGRHKIANTFEEQPYVVVSCNEEKGVYQIRPVAGGKARWVNRQLLISDPRKETDTSFDRDPLQVLPCTQDSSDSENESDEDDIFLSIPPQFFHDDNSGSSREKTSVKDDRGGVSSDVDDFVQPTDRDIQPRRSKRLRNRQKIGQWPNAVT